MASKRRKPPVFTEKEFYLDEFRGRTLLVSVHHDGAAEQLRELGQVARDLLANDTRVLILLAGAATRERATLRVLERALAEAPATVPVSPAPPIRLATPDGDAPLLALARAELEADPLPDALLLRVWSIVRATPFFLGLCEDAAPELLAAFAQRLGARLRVHKLVLADPDGGVHSPGAAALSFMDGAVTEQLLHAGEAEWAGVGARRALLEAIDHGLKGGIGSINLCALDGLARELFTYEGSGTLFTLEDYCRVAPLGLDDFHEVEKLVERGEREGYLKPRTPEEIGRILLSGYGATIGAHHLAGICSLQTEGYERDRAGEIVGLYTITRFKGEGVGVKLVDCMKAEGRRHGLAYLFACTTQERVGQFFERQGFRRVPHEEAPAEKWTCYAAARRSEVAVYRHDLGAGRD